MRSRKLRLSIVAPNGFAARFAQKKSSIAATEPRALLHRSARGLALPLLFNVSLVSRRASGASAPDRPAQGTYS
jgi:hypothetical protein